MDELDFSVTSYAAFVVLVVPLCCLILSGIGNPRALQLVGMSCEPVCGSSGQVFLSLSPEQ